MLSKNEVEIRLHIAARLFVSCQQPHPSFYIPFHCSKPTYFKNPPPLAVLAAAFDPLMCVTQPLIM
jgi:hypothetical protein